MSNWITDTVIYIIGSELTKLKEKQFYGGTDFLNTLLYIPAFGENVCLMIVQMLLMGINLEHIVL